MENMIFIEGNVPSSKNSRITNRKTGRSFMSKNCSKYIKDTKQYFELYKDKFLGLCKDKPKPLRIAFHFVRDSKRKYDFHNMVQLPLDLMVKNEWIEDDNITEVLPFPLSINGSYTSVDRDNPGCYIKVL